MRVIAVPTPARRTQNQGRAPELKDVICNDPVAAKLIADHIPMALRATNYWQSKLPLEDVEPAVMQALYMAAFTFDPSKGYKFVSWLKWKILGALSRYNRKTKAACPLGRREPFDELEVVDHRGGAKQESIEYAAHLRSYLSARHEEVIHYLYDLGMNTYEAAKAMGCTRQNVDQHHKMALASLRRIASRNLCQALNAA
jgi:RNA polymerase sigma factor (sigma-70 family)